MTSTGSAGSALRHPPDSNLFGGLLGRLTFGAGLAEPDLQGLLQIDGLDRAWYRELFGADVLDHLPELERLGDLATFGDRLTLTDEGLAWSDAIGPWLYSDAVTARMAEWEQR